jgi:acetyl esterase/lipase
MRLICIVLLSLVAFVSSEEEAIDIWEGPPPYSKENSLEEYVKESWGVPCVHNVTRPTLTIHPAQGENSGRAMIILPGGGYEVESFIAEGRQIAEHLSSHGITAAVLKYRLPLAEASDQPHLVPLTDARRAVQLMKSMAETSVLTPPKWGSWDSRRAAISQLPPAC